MFASRYELISFSTLPYKEALRRGSVNDMIVEELVKDNKEKDITKVDLQKAKELIEKHLVPLIEQQKATHR